MIQLQISITGGEMPGVAAQVLRDIRELAEQRDDVRVTTVQPGLRIEPDSRTVVNDGRPVQLTRREFDLLLFLCEHPRRVFRRDQLLTQVWGYEWIGGSRTVDVHVRRLRMKLGEATISTVHGVGYRLDDQLRVAIKTE